jgi:hypothetical protein
MILKNFKRERKKLRDFSQHLNYTDRATSAYRRSLVPTFVGRGCRVVSATNPHGPYAFFFIYNIFSTIKKIPTAVNFGFLDRSRHFLEIAPQLSSRG